LAGPGIDSHHRRAAVCRSPLRKRFISLSFMNRDPPRRGGTEHPQGVKKSLRFRGVVDPLGEGWMDVRTPGVLKDIWEWTLWSF